MYCLLKLKLQPSGKICLHMPLVPLLKFLCGVKQPKRCTWSLSKGTWLGAALPFISHACCYLEARGCNMFNIHAWAFAFSKIDMEKHAFQVSWETSVKKKVTNEYTSAHNEYQEMSNDTRMFIDWWSRWN